MCQVQEDQEDIQTTSFFLKTNLTTTTNTPVKVPLPTYFLLQSDGLIKSKVS